MSENLSIDLDALAPEIGEITLGGNKILVYPPSVKDIMYVARTFQKYSELAQKDTENISLEEIEGVIDEITQSFVNFVPELKDKKLNIQQLFALKELMEKMLSPKSFEALADNNAHPIGSTEKKEESSLT